MLSFRGFVIYVKGGEKHYTTILFPTYQYDGDKGHPRAPSKNKMAHFDVESKIGYISRSIATPKNGLSSFVVSRASSSSNMIYALIGEP